MPGDSPVMQRVVHHNRMRLKRCALGVCVDSSSRRSLLSVTVPLHETDFSAATRVIIGQPPTRPATAGKAVEFYSCLPSGPDGSSPGTTD